MREKGVTESRSRTRKGIQTLPVKVKGGGKSTSVRKLMPAGERCACLGGFGAAFGGGRGGGGGFFGGGGVFLKGFLFF